MINPMVEKTLAEIKNGHPDAYEFLHLFGLYCSAIDDLVDEQKNNARVAQVTLLASQVHNCNFWKNHYQQLTIVERLIMNSYFDSVEWESAPEVWKRVTARVHAHDGMLMTFAVILIEFGDDKLKLVSRSWREQAYSMHKEDYESLHTDNYPKP